MRIAAEHPRVAIELLSASELEAEAARVLPKAVYDFVARGSGDERTDARNREAFEKFALKQRVLSGVSAISLRTELLGGAIEAPMLVAPMGGHGNLHPSAEHATAAAAAATGVGFILALGSSVPLEDIPPSTTPRWFQLYLQPDRGITGDLLDRAESGGYNAIVVTADTTAAGLRRSDLRNIADGDRFESEQANLLRYGPASRQANPAPSDVHLPLEVQRIGWADIEWLVSRTRLPVIVKGVMRGDDAVLALESGAAGLVVSNHGGRHFDPVLPTVSALPEVNAAVAGRIPVLIDSGIRRGSDVAVALALGAAAVLLGRPVLWALAIGGEAGVQEYLHGIKVELARTLAMLGVGSPGGLSPDCVQIS